jgi:serine protease
MTPRRLSSLALAFVLCGLLPAALRAADEPEARVIVKLRAGSGLLREAQADASAPAPARAVGRLGRRLGLSLDEGRPVGARIQAVRLRGLSSEQLVARLAVQPEVEYAVVDRLRRPALVPNDPRFGSGQPSPYAAAGQWYLQASDSVLVSAVGAPAAWDLSQGAGSGGPLVVAVIDTGVRYDHEDLAGKLLPGYNMISEAAKAGNSGGRSSDASDLGDWLTATEINLNRRLYSGCDVETTSSWHGTQVAGIVGAATGNGLGMAGLGWNVKVLPVRVLGKCGGYDSDIIAGMRWAAGLAVDGVPANPNPARVLNLSLGSSSACSSAYQDVMRELTAAGVAVVASAGNNEGQAVESPANCPGVIAVGGLRHAGTKVGYSAVGSEIAVSAPGGNCVNTAPGSPCLYPILSTSNSGATTPVAHASGGSIYTGGGNDSAVGTSFSAPQVSAAAALMLAVRPALQPADLKQLLSRTARAFPTTGGSTGIAQCVAPGAGVQDECYCTTRTCGGGMLDAGQAVAAAATSAVPRVALTPAAPQPGQQLRLDGGASLPSIQGTSIVSWQWDLVDGGGIVGALTASAQTGEVLAAPAAVGRFTVRLTVVDDQGHSAAATQDIQVGSVSSQVDSRASHHGGGGGGSLDAAGIVALLAATATLARRRRAH